MLEIKLSKEIQDFKEKKVFLKRLRGFFNTNFDKFLLFLKNTFPKRMKMEVLNLQKVNQNWKAVLVFTYPISKKLRLECRYNQIRQLVTLSIPEFDISCTKTNPNELFMQKMDEWIHKNFVIYLNNFESKIKHFNDDLEYEILFDSVYFQKTKKELFNICKHFLEIAKIGRVNKVDFDLKKFRKVELYIIYKYLVNLLDRITNWSEVLHAILYHSQNKEIKIVKVKKVDAIYKLLALKIPLSENLSLYAEFSYPSTTFIAILDKEGRYLYLRMHNKLFKKVFDNITYALNDIIPERNFEFSIDEYLEKYGDLEKKIKQFNDFRLEDMLAYWLI